MQPMPLKAKFFAAEDGLQANQACKHLIRRMVVASVARLPGPDGDRMSPFDRFDVTRGLKTSDNQLAGKLRSRVCKSSSQQQENTNQHESRGESNVRVC